MLPHHRLLRPRLPARYATIAMPFVLSIVMTFVVSAISTLKTIGMTEGVVSAWLLAWSLSWLVAFPTLLFVLPLARLLVAWLVEPSGSSR